MQTCLTTKYILVILMWIFVIAGGWNLSSFHFVTKKFAFNFERAKMSNKKLFKEKQFLVFKNCFFIRLFEIEFMFLLTYLDYFLLIVCKIFKNQKGSTLANQNQTEREARCFQYGREIEEGIRKFIFTARGKLPKDEKELIKYCK